MYDYDRSASVKTSMHGSLWAAIGFAMHEWVATIAYDLVKHLPHGWEVKDIGRGAMNQLSSSATFANGSDQIRMTLNLGKDMHVVGFAALELGRDLKSNIKLNFDSFSSPEVVARNLGAELNKLFAADATMTRLF
jgi:hypothetical protein